MGPAPAPTLGPEYFRDVTPPLLTCVYAVTSSFSGAAVRTATPEPRAAAHGTGTAQGSMIHTVLPPSAVGVICNLPPDSAMR